MGLSGQAGEVCIRSAVGVGVHWCGRPGVDVRAGRGRDQPHTRPAVDNDGRLGGVQAVGRVCLTRAAKRITLYFWLMKTSYSKVMI